jgi:hypothetical protein
LQPGACHGGGGEGTISVTARSVIFFQEICRKDFEMHIPENVPGNPGPVSFTGFPKQAASDTFTKNIFPD